ncbi:MAG: hypothetical protein Q8O67_29075 [Deltaproteobacteria bacterium]|nr:hypothetical protein [Deltaproteobacteria bacterium]
MTLSIAAKNQFLTTIAGVIDRGTLPDPAALKLSAAQAAADVAAAHPGTTAGELMAELPQAWSSAPSSFETKKQASAFLQVAGPVLGVNVASAGAITTRCLNALDDANVTIAINRARASLARPPPSLSNQLAAGIATAPLFQALQGAFADKALLELVGGAKYKHLIADTLVREAVGTFSCLHDPPPPSVLAGGVEVAGPAISKQVKERPNGTFRQVGLPNPVGALALALVEVAALRRTVTEEDLRSAILGKPCQLLSGRVPGEGAFPLHLAKSDDGQTLAVGLGIDLKALRAFQGTDLDDAALVKSVGQLLRRLDGELKPLLTGGIPVGIALDPACAKAAVVVAARAVA